MTATKGDILVVDDIPENVRLLFLMLAKEGYEVRQTINGEQALKAVRYDPPDVILLDIMMPHMDGYEVCRRLRSNSKTSEIPIIFISVKSEPFDKVKAFQVGGNDYITKPFYIEEVLARIENQLARVRQQRQLADRNAQLTREIQDRQRAEQALHSQQAFLSAVIDANPNLIFVRDEEGRFTLVNQALADLYSTNVESLIGKTEAELNRDRAQPVYFSTPPSQPDNPSPNRAAYPLRTASGEVRWFQTTELPLSSLEGEPLVLSVWTDITERQQAEETLWLQAERERLLRTIAQHIRQSLNLGRILEATVTEVRQFLGCDRVLIYRREGQARDRITVESTSSGACPLVETGTTQQWLLQFMQAFERHPDLAIEAIEDVRTAALPERVRETLDRLQIRATLVVPIPYSQSVEWACNGQNQLWGLLVAHQCCDPRPWQSAEIDVLESLAEQIAIAIQHGELHEKLANANRELERLAHLDGLTGLANRRCFDDYLALEWRRMQREGQSLSLIMADVDFFKAYNDTYGHPQGDDCLKAVARAIDRCTKRPADLAARYGGEEFAIVLPNTSLEGALTIACTIQDCVKQLDLEHERSEIGASVTLSLGVASCVPQPELSWEGLLQLADEALYRAKESGRNCVIPMQVTVERAQNFARSVSNL